jgi:hypothetical protein
MSILSERIFNIPGIEKRQNEISNFCENIEELICCKTGGVSFLNSPIISFNSSWQVEISSDEIKNLPNFDKFYIEKLSKNKHYLYERENVIFDNIVIKYEREESRFVFTFKLESNDSLDMFFDDEFDDECDDMYENFYIDEETIIENGFLVNRLGNNYNRKICDSKIYDEFLNNIKKYYTSDTRKKVYSFFKKLKKKSKYSEYINISNEKNSLLKIEFSNIIKKSKPVTFYLHPTENKICSSKRNVVHKDTKDTKMIDILGEYENVFLQNIENVYNNYFKIEEFSGKLKIDIEKLGYDASKLTFTKKYDLNNILMYTSEYNKFPLSANMSGETLT